MVFARLYRGWARARGGPQYGAGSSWCGSACSSRDSCCTGGLSSYRSQTSSHYKYKEIIGSENKKTSRMKGDKSASRIVVKTGSGESLNNSHKSDPLPSNIVFISKHLVLCFKNDMLTFFKRYLNNFTFPCSSNVLNIFSIWISTMPAYKGVRMCKFFIFKSKLSHTTN